MTIIENFLPPGFAETLYSRVCGYNVEWTFTPESTMTGMTNPCLYVVDSNTVKPCQFSRVVFADNRSLDKELFLLANILFQFASEKLNIEPVEFYRVKYNLLTKDIRFDDTKYGIAHSDVWEVTEDRNYKSLLYYINDSDGDTFMFNEYATDNPNTRLTIHDRITPKMGKAVYFDSTRFHASSNPVQNTARFVINYTFKI